MKPQEWRVFFYICSCLKDQKVRCILNLLCLGEKDWWRLLAGAYSPTEKPTVTWEQFSNMFCIECVSLVERESRKRGYISGVSIECVSLTESVTEITTMFRKRALFFPEYATSEQVQMSRYLSMPMIEIREFVPTQRYSFLSHMYSFAWKRQIEIKTQKRVKRQTPTQPRPTTNRFNPMDSRYRGYRGALWRVQKGARGCMSISYQVPKMLQRGALFDGFSSPGSTVEYQDLLSL